MKNVFLYLILGCATLASCTTKSAKPNPISVQYIDVNMASSIITKDHNTIILDVRTPQEFNAGHLPNALNISIHDEQFSEKVNKLNKSKHYIVHCAANVKNGRSAKSLKVMSDLGFPYLSSMNGGYAAWKEAGKAVIKD